MPPVDTPQVHLLFNRYRIGIPKSTASGSPIDKIEDDMRSSHLESVFESYEASIECHSIRRESVSVHAEHEFENLLGHSTLDFAAAPKYRK